MAAAIIPNVPGRAIGLEQRLNRVDGPIIPSVKILWAVVFSR